MSKQILLTLAKTKGGSNSADIVEQININTGSGNAVRVQAVNNVYYQLTDLSTQYGPENIMVERVGDDLYVAFEGENVETPSLIIEDYYRLDPNGSKNLLVGLHENGSFYPYVPESAQQADAIHMLADHVAAGQALGGDSHLGAFAPIGGGSVSGISPWAILGGLAAVGGIAAAASSGHNDHKNNNDHSNIEPAPKPPVPQAPGNDPVPNISPVAHADRANATAGSSVTVDVLANDTDPQGNGTIDKGSVKLLDSTGKAVTTLTVTGEGTWTVGTDGKITFTPEAGFTDNPTIVHYIVSDED
ncbi:MAG: Ig-like domain-containing protein, partial [Cardiobacteriaceae bacterium]|nr:Ig-like domain-containing protein [Cardiobacteriaceae bacterium]